MFKKNFKYSADKTFLFLGSRHNLRCDYEVTALRVDDINNQPNGREPKKCAFAVNQIAKQNSSDENNTNMILYRK